MAEDGEKSSGPNHVAEVFLVVIILLFIGALITKQSIFEVADPDSPQAVEVEREVDRTLFSRMFGNGDFGLGQNIVSLKEIAIRNAPGGTILGLQERLSLGRLMEGPVEKFNAQWWRVSFEDAPSGWVEKDFITTKTALAKTFYFPFTFYKNFKPIGWIITIIVAIIVLIFRAKFWREHSIRDARMADRHEQAQKRKKTEEVKARDKLGLPTEEEFKNPRWQHVQDLMKSKSQSDWRQAIIEADIILDEMLRRMGYTGLTIGDILKNIEPSDFINLEKAWEAHKFRNEIAHTGSEFQLAKGEAERVIDLYRTIFDEFYYV
jgi:uncharacterized membrane protein